MPGVIQELRRWPDRGLRQRLVFWSIGFWVLATTILTATFLLVGQREILNETRLRNVQIASVVSRDVSAQMGSIVADARTFERHMEALSPDLESQASAMLALRLSAPQHYRAIYYFDPQGKLLLHLGDTASSLLTLKTNDIVFREPVAPDEGVMTAYRAVSGSMMAVSEVDFTGIDRVPVIYIGVPLIFEHDNRIAVVEVDLRDIWQRIELSTLGETGLTYAVSRKGIIVAHNDSSYLGREIPAEIEPVLSGFEGFVEYTEPYKGKAVFAAYSPVGGPTGLGIVVQQEEAETHAPLVRAAIIITVVWLPLAIIGTIGIMIMTRTFTKPIAELTETAKDIARTGKLTQTSLEQRSDEVGQLSQAFDQMIERLQATEGRLATAAADERNRLARDLHDAVSQTLFSASLIADVLPRLWERNPNEARRRLEEVRQLTRGALAEMRTLLLELRPTALVEAELPLLLSQLAESISGRSRVPVTVSVEGECGALPVEVKVALYRVAQEALNNIAKHSGATQARVELRCESASVFLKIADDGRGFEMTGIRSNSLGLGIMRERAAGIGGVLSVQSKIGAGTEVTVAWSGILKEAKL